MSYRVEVSSSGRAGCQSTDCKKLGNKIPKDELRLGTWVDIPDRGGSWRWRHWGCVTGKILQNIRSALDPSGSGDYSWDSLDGYQGEEKSSLEHHPDLQEKVRRVIIQGFIDHNEFNGDPEMNKLGCSGLRVPVSKKKNPKKDRDDSLDIEGLKEQLNVLAAERNSVLKNGGPLSKIDAQLAIVQQALVDIEKSKNPTKKPITKKSASRKRGRNNDNSDSEEPLEEKVEMPAKKKRISAKDRIKMEAENKIKGEEESEIPVKKKRISAKDRIKMEPKNQEIKGEEELEIPVKKKRVSVKDRIKMEAEIKATNDEDEEVKTLTEKKCIKKEAEAENRKNKNKTDKRIDKELHSKNHLPGPEENSSCGPIKNEGLEQCDEPHEEDIPKLKNNGQIKRALKKEEETEPVDPTDREGGNSSPKVKCQDADEIKKEKEEYTCNSIGENGGTASFGEETVANKTSAPKRKLRSKNPIKST